QSVTEAESAVARGEGADQAACRISGDPRGGRRAPRAARAAELRDSGRRRLPPLLPRAPRARERGAGVSARARPGDADRDRAQPGPRRRRGTGADVGERALAVGWARDRGRGKPRLDRSRQRSRPQPCARARSRDRVGGDVRRAVDRARRQDLRRPGRGRRHAPDARHDLDGGRRRDRGGRGGQGAAALQRRGERHTERVEALRGVEAKALLIPDGDVAPAIAAAQPNTGVDLLMGVGGTPEGVLSASALKCVGGALQGKLWPRDDEERQKLIEAGFDLDRVLTTDDLVGGDVVFFAATGVTAGALLRGVRYTPDGVVTDSIVMRSRSGTVRRVEAFHSFDKLEALSGGRYRR